MHPQELEDQIEKNYLALKDNRDLKEELIEVIKGNTDFGRRLSKEFNTYNEAQKCNFSESSKRELSESAKVEAMTPEIIQEMSALREENESVEDSMNKIILEQSTPGKSPQNNADIEEASNQMLYIDSKNKINSKNSNPQNNNMGFDSAEEQDKCFNTMDTFLTGDLDLLKKEAAGDMGDARSTQKYKQLDYKSENREKESEQKFH